MHYLIIVSELLECCVEESVGLWLIIYDGLATGKKEGGYGLVLRKGERFPLQLETRGRGNLAPTNHCSSPIPVNNCTTPTD